MSPECYISPARVVPKRNPHRILWHGRADAVSPLDRNDITGISDDLGKPDRGKVFALAKSIRVNMPKIARFEFGILDLGFISDLGFHASDFMLWDTVAARENERRRYDTSPNTKPAGETSKKDCFPRTQLSCERDNDGLAPRPSFSETVCERLSCLLRRPFSFSEHPFYCSASTLICRNAAKRAKIEEMASGNPSSDDVVKKITQKAERLMRREEEHRSRDLAKKLDFPYRDLQTSPIDGAALTMRPLEEQQRAHAVIIQRRDHTLAVAAHDPHGTSFSSFQKLLEGEGFTVKTVVVSETSLKHAWSLYSRFAYLSTKITGEVAITPEVLERFREEILDIGNLTARLKKTEARDISVLVELLLAGALELDASDIHVEPHEDGGAKIRYRLDGLLHDLTEIRNEVYRLLLERIKLLSGLKLNITHRGQDGRFTIHAQEEEIEIRSSTLPGKDGEFIVLRILNPKNLLDVPELGLREDLLTRVEEELKRPNGMILATGPTGSGKTTMLYAFLKRITSPEVKTITIEDPIEYRLPDIEQTQVNPNADYTFAVGLKSIVRQDPDVILVGEIRDAETASIALQAALTGHLVFSTLHTNDAAGALPRLIDFGLSTSIVGPAINIIIAQRLVRRVCPRCSKEVVPDAKTEKTIRTLLRTLPKQVRVPDLSSFMLREAQGCTKCHNTGYRGRIGIYELLRVDDEAERIIATKPSIAEFRHFALDRGMVTLQKDALLRVVEGITTLKEVLRITGPIVPKKATGGAKEKNVS